MAEVVINQNYVIGSGQTLDYTNASGFIFLLAGSWGAPDPTFTNKGQVTITADTYVGVDGVYDDSATLRPTGYFHNAAGASMVISNTDGNAFGFDSSSWSSDVFNDGLIQVSAPAEYTVAFGVRSNSPSGFEFKNTGTLQVSGYMAWGVVMLHGGAFINSGLIQVTGGHNGNPIEACGVDLGAPSSFSNTGRIIASDVDNGHNSAGVYFDYASGPQSITNKGLISGAYSIDAAYGVTNVTIQNSGTLKGDVDLSNTSGVDSVTNSGQIIGNVTLNQLNATGGVYNGAHGSVTGTIFGTSGNDTLTGGAGNDVFAGGAGDDVINGGGGINTAVFSGDYSAYHIATSGSTTTVTGPGGTDTLTNIQILQFADEQMVLGSKGQTLTARPGGDTLVGGPGNDTLIGGTGNDILIGGAGQDTLTGGSGQNSFVFTAATDSKVAAPDLITNFVSGPDKIDISDLNADLAAGYSFHLGATATHTGDIVVSYEAAQNRTVVEFWVGDHAKADMEIWLTGDHLLTSSDFVL